MGKVILSGVSKGMTAPSAMPPVSEFAEGSIVKINENGNPVEFYVARHDYERVLNGPGRTLLVRKDCYDTRKWHSSNVNAWASCDLRSWLNGGYLNLLDENIRRMIGTTKYYYTPGNGTTSVTTRSDAVFQLSLTELGKTATYANTEGTVLPIVFTLQIAYCNGSTVAQWTRSPDWNTSVSAYYLDTNQSFGANGCHLILGSRPAFTLPSNIKIADDGTVIA